MKFSQSALLATLATTAVVNAAPAQVHEGSSEVAAHGNALAKRESLESALMQLKELDEMRVKRQDMDLELSEREYKIVTEVLSAINDTNLAPTVLKFFVTQPTLRKIAINAITFVIRNASINLTTLVKALVDSGLLSRVLTDALSDCEVYVSVIGIATDVIRALLGRIFSKRELLGVGEDDILTHEQTIELLKKDGLMQPIMLQDKRALDLDVGDIVNNLLESLANSGLASSVVIAVLTDPAFIDFGADLIKEIMDGPSPGIGLSDLVLAVTQSGLIPELLKTLLNTDTLATIGQNVLKAVSGRCGDGSSGAITTTTTRSSAAAAPTTYIGSATIVPIDTSATTKATTASKVDVDTVYTTVNKQSKTLAGEATSIADPCETAYNKREFKKLRLNY